MLPAVYLYNYSLFETHEIHNIAPYWLLTAKLESF
jgi:hypothetical protein